MVKWWVVNFGSWVDFRRLVEADSRAKPRRCRRSLGSGERQRASSMSAEPESRPADNGEESRGDASPAKKEESRSVFAGAVTMCGLLARGPARGSSD